MVAVVGVAVVVVLEDVDVASRAVLSVASRETWSPSSVAKLMTTSGMGPGASDGNNGGEYSGAVVSSSRGSLMTMSCTASRLA